MDEHVRVFDLSCPPFANLFGKLKHLSATELGIPGIAEPTDPRYAAVVWKRLFLITLERLSERHPTLARVLAVHAIKALSVVSSRTKYPAAQELAVMDRLRYSRGQLKTNLRLHPDDMLCRYYEAKQVLASSSIHEDAVATLWRKWRVGRIPSDLTKDLSRLKRAETRAKHFLATAYDYDPDSLNVLLSRARKKTHLTFPQQ